MSGIAINPTVFRDASSSESSSFLMREIPCRGEIVLKERFTIAVFGAYGQGNLGDEAILHYMLSQLNNAVTSSGDEVRFIVYSHDKAKTLASTRVEHLQVVELPRNYLDVRKFLQVLQSVFCSDLLIVGGGSVIYDAILLPLSCLILFAKVLRKKVMCYAIGMSHVRSKGGRLVALFLLNAVDLITVRDSDALRFMRRLHVIRPQILATADPVVNITPEESGRIEKILADEDIGRNGRPWIGFSVRSWRGMGDDPVIFERIRSILQHAIKYSVEELGADAILVPLSFGEESDDRQVASELKESVHTTNGDHIKVLTGEYTAEEACGIIGFMDMLVGMRLHSLIMASTRGVPIIAINYDPKVKGFMRMMGLPEQVIEPYDSVEKSLGIVKSTWANRDVVARKLNEKVAVLREMSTANSTLAVNLLQSGAQSES